VGNITPKGNHYWVEVFGVWNGQKNSNPDVVPELAFETVTGSSPTFITEKQTSGERKLAKHSGST